MLTLAVPLFLAVTVSSAPPSHAPESVWLQGRLDRVLVVAGRTGGSVRVEVGVDDNVSPGGADQPLRIPRTALLLARNAAEVDGLLAMLLAYRPDRAEAVGRRRLSALEILSYAGLIAATGGASDPAVSKESTQIPIDLTYTGRTNADTPNAAWRGERWNTQMRHCTATLAGYLRRLSRPQEATAEGIAVKWPGDPFSQRVVRQLGVLASPGSEQCEVDESSDGGLSDLKRILAG